jgi:hypothetical protein
MIVLAIVTLQSTIFGYFPLNYLQPDLLLLVAVYVGLNRSLFEGGTFIILSAMIMEAHSGAGKNYFLTVYLYTFLIAKLLSRTVVVPDFLASIVIVSTLTVLKRIGILVLLGMEGRAGNGLRHFFIYIIPGLLVQALLTPAVFAWFRHIDLKTYKDEHSEDEYDINKGI